MIKYFIDLIYHINKKIYYLLAAIHFNSKAKKNKLTSLEKEFNELLKFANKGDQAIDIGANIGRYTFRLSKLVGNSGHVYSFEPLQSSFFILNFITFFRDYKNITLFNLAVGENIGEVNFNENREEPVIIKGKNDKRIPYLFHTNSGSRITKNKNDFKRFKITIDSIFEHHKIDLIKIDVEGSEYDVIRGAEKTIVKNKPVVIIETAHSDEKKILNFFAKLNYKIYNYKKNENQRNILFYFES